MSIFFTSDQHFDHGNILSYCNRPFKNIDEMNAVMVARWNERVSNLDTVYHLGDFTLSGPDVASGFFRQLNGKIRILGNNWHHDKRWLERGYYSDFDFFSAFDVVTILPALVVLEFPQYSKDGKYPRAITLCHYPMAEWDRSHHGGWHLHGHSHGNYVYPPGTLALDVGVDRCNFYPVSLEEVAQAMEEKETEK